MASIHDIYIDQGADFVQALDITGDYTDYLIRGKIEDSVGTLGSSIVAWTDASLGQFTITITNAVTSTMANGVGKYDIEIETPAGIAERIIKGRAYVDSEVAV